MRMTAIAVTALVLTAGACMAAEPTGAALYGTKCASCHGKDGRGNDKIAKMLKVTLAELDLTGPAVVKASDADLAKIIADGKGKKMPAFAKKLTAQQIKDIVAAIRAMAAPAK